MMNVSLFSLRPKRRLRRSSSSDIQSQSNDNNGSDHTGVTAMIDPIVSSSDEDLMATTKKELKMQNKQNKKKLKQLRKGKKKRSGISKLFRASKSNGTKPRNKDHEEYERKNRPSYEMTEESSSGHDFSQEEIGKWIRKQRALKEVKAETPSTSSTVATFKATNVTKTQGINTTTTSKVRKKPKSRKSKSIEQPSPEERKSQDLESDQETGRENPPPLFVVDNSMNSGSSLSLLSTPDSFEATPEDIPKDKETASKSSPSPLPRAQISLPSTTTTTLPSSAGTSSSSSTATMEASTATMDVEPINPLRQYPSKKRRRKKSRNHSSAAHTSPSIVNEIHRLGSLVDVMMTRMDLQEQQSECLVQAGLAYNEQQKKKTPTASQQNSSTCSGKEPPTPCKKQEFMTSTVTTTATSTPLPSPQKENYSVNVWLAKLEGMQDDYQTRLAATKDEFKALKDKKKLLRKAKRTPTASPTTQKGETTNRSRSKRSKSNRSVSQRTRSSQKRASIISRSNHRSTASNRSKSNRSLSSRTSVVEDESSLRDCGRIETVVGTETSTHSATTDSSRTDRNVKFNPTVNVATTLSRHDMCPNEKFQYWSSDRDDEMTEDVLQKLTEKWKVQKLGDEIEEKLSVSQHSRSSSSDKSLSLQLVSDEIIKLLPTTEREGNEGYTYTIEIQD